MLPQPSKPYIGLAALAYFSLAQGLGEEALLEQRHVQGSSDTGISEG